MRRFNILMKIGLLCFALSLLSEHLGLFSHNFQAFASGFGVAILLTGVYKEVFELKNCPIDKLENRLNKKC